MINLTNELSSFMVSGVDAATLLQGQTTNDINLLNNNQWQFSAHLNHKGRILAIFIIYKFTDDKYLLITHSSVIDGIIKRLKMFVLRSKVEFNLLQNNILFVNNYNSSNDQEVIIHMDHKFSLLITTSEVAPINHDTNLWHQYLIAQKKIFITDKLAGLFIPQHIEFDGISYTKGCYTGQEIVARTHYLGKSKKSLQNTSSNTRYNIADEYNATDCSGVVLDYYYDDTADNKYQYLLTS
jgi:folate-binding protein YgfZ